MKKSRHHMLARSRGGKNKKNIVHLPDDWHAQWHQLFGLLTPEEAKEMIDIVMQPGRRWTKGEIDGLKVRLMRERC